MPSSAILLLALALASALFFCALAQNNSESPARHERTFGPSLTSAPSNLAIFVSLAIVLLSIIIHFWRKRATASKGNAQNAAAKAVTAKRAAPVIFSFRDHFAGTTESLSHINIPLLPDEQAALVQVTRPLQLMRAAAWFVGRRWPAAGRQRLRQQPLPPLDCLRDGCSARVPARAMFGLVATACRRLASAPGDGTTWRLAGWVMECATRGGVRRVQVQPQRRAAVSRHMCVFCNRLLQQTLADVQVMHCKAPHQHAPRCRTPRFPAHALFAVCCRRQPRTLRCARQTRGERSPAACSPNLRAETSRP